MLKEFHKAKLINLAKALVDQDRAKIIMPTHKDAPGFWSGAGNLVESADGTLYLCGRYRNSGDSRTGTIAGTRGAELAIFKSQNNGKSYEKILSFSKEDLSYEGCNVISIERAWIFYNENSVELYVSSEKAGLRYPKEVEEFQKPGTGIWTIDLITADSVENLDPSNISCLFKGTDPQFLHLKDPFLYTNDAGDTILMFSIHPFNWASSNTGMAVRRKGEDEFGMISYDFFPRGFTWDVAISRMTGVFKVPRSGAFADLPQIYLLFYDGGESMRNYDDHCKAVKRPRGYSCEEIGGLAYTTEEDFPKMYRLSKYRPLFISPNGTGCSRYASTLQTQERIYTTWCQSQKSLSQPLVCNTLEIIDLKVYL